MVVDTRRASSGKMALSPRGPIVSVAAANTGWGRLHREHIFGTRKPALWWIFMGRAWVRVPLGFFVIEHAEGLVLFDTGQDRRVVTDPDYWPDRITELFMRNLFRWEIDPDDTLSAALEHAGYSLDDVSTAVISHLHADHVGGIREIPGAQLVASVEAWEHMRGPHPEREMVLRRDIEIPGAKWRQITLEPTDDPSVAPFTHAHDLMGDGSMMLLPTPGHLPGSMSMLVRTPDAPPLLFVADACYSIDMLMQDRLPGTGDKAEFLDTYEKIRALRARLPGLVILPSHDPDSAERLRAAVEQSTTLGSRP